MEKPPLEESVLGNADARSGVAPSATSVSFPTYKVLEVATISIADPSSAGQVLYGADLITSGGVLNTVADP